MAKTAFRPEEHGYPFVNAWKMKAGERTQLRQTPARSTDEAATTIGSDPFGLIRNTVTQAVGSWIDAALPDYYGLCGGMAFSAADHFRAGKPVPHGSNPQQTPDSEDPEEKAIRDYLWKRQLESLQSNGAVLLSWMAMLHLPVPGAGPTWLHDRTREQFANLKNFLTYGPWPLCLIGTSTSPFNNHQVLAIGLDDNGDQTGVIYLYDSNGPGREQTITLDMRGPVLQAVETCPSPDRGPLCGFFCMHYTPAIPPESLPRKVSPAKPPATPVSKATPITPPEDAPQAAARRAAPKTVAAPKAAPRPATPPVKKPEPET